MLNNTHTVLHHLKPLRCIKMRTPLWLRHCCKLWILLKKSNYAMICINTLLNVSELCLRYVTSLRGPSQIGISYACLRFWNLESCLSKKLYNFGYLGIFYLNIFQLPWNLTWNLKSLTKIPKIRNLVCCFISWWTPRTSYK